MAVQTEEFIDRVAGRTGAGRDEAARATSAVLTALAQALPEREALDLAAQLPDELQEVVERGAGQDPGLDRLAFLARVAELTGGDGDETEGRARAVLETLQESVSFGNIADTVSALPADLADLAGTRRT